MARINTANISLNFNYNLDLKKAATSSAQRLYSLPEGCNPSTANSELSAVDSLVPGVIFM